MAQYNSLKKGIESLEKDEIGTFDIGNKQYDIAISDLQKPYSYKDGKIHIGQHHIPTTRQEYKWFKENPDYFRVWKEPQMYEINYNEKHYPGAIDMNTSKKLKANSGKQAHQLATQKYGFKPNDYRFTKRIKESE